MKPPLVGAWEIYRQAQFSKMLVRATCAQKSPVRMRTGLFKWMLSYFFGARPGTVIDGESDFDASAFGAAAAGAGAVAGRSLFTSFETSSVMSYALSA